MGSAQFDLVSGSFSSVSPIWTLWCIALACDAVALKQQAASKARLQCNQLTANLRNLALNLPKPFRKPQIFQIAPNPLAWHLQVQWLPGTDLHRTCTSFLRNLRTLETWNPTLCMGLHVPNPLSRTFSSFPESLEWHLRFRNLYCETPKHSAVWGRNYRRCMLDSSPPCFQTQPREPAFSLRSSKSDLAWHDAANTMIHGTQIAQSSSRLSWTQRNS